MCGIAGIFGSVPGDPARMEAMLNALSHRGPDDSGIHTGDGVVLGHRRLSIIDLEGGHQPIANHDRSIWLVFNGEIYNFKEQRSRLEGLGRKFSTHSDSEVIVQLYEQHGEKCVDYLRGMFSFALWDRNLRTLFAARDHLGQKPFFYSRQGDRLLFGSEIKALLAADPSLAELDLEAFDQYLNLRVIASPRTMFQRIRKLPPGHLMTFKEGRLEIRRYWDLDFEPKHTGNEEELVDRLEAEIIDSLRHHIVSDVPVGAFLSGGLDSTLVVSMLKRHVTSEAIQTFSLGLPYKQFDEAPYARLVAEKYGAVHREETIRPSLTKWLPKLVWNLDEPSDPLSVCLYLISEIASRHVKVVLGGDGGDELFGGYDRYYGNRYASMYARVPAGIRKYLLGPMLNMLPDGGWYKSRAHQAKWLHRLSFLEGGARYAASLEYFFFNADRRCELYGPRIADTMQAMDPGASIREPFQQARAANIIDRMLYADTQVRQPDHPVMILDRMTMAHSLEARSPLMDHRLVEFSARLPWKMKVAGRTLRYIQLRLAERYLPGEILRRPKQGFASALPYMLKDEYARLQKVFLKRSHLAGDGILRQNVIDRYTADQDSRRTDHRNRLWLLINSEVWYRMFIEGQSIEDLERLISKG